MSMRESASEAAKAFDGPAIPNIRANFLCFAPKIVEHSRYLPAGEQNTVKELRWVQRAFVPREDLKRAVTAVLTLFVCPVALHIVITHPLAVDGDHLFPRCGPCELGVCHFADDIEVSLDQILPGLPLLDAQLFNPQCCVHIHRLMTGKNPAPVTDNGFRHACGRERCKEHFQVVPLILGGGNLAGEDGAGVTFENADQIDWLWKP